MDATARASATDAYTNAEARLPLSWTNGPVGIDAGNTKTNVYGGMVVKLGPRVQQGTGNASGDYSFAGHNSTASGDGAWANYFSTASGDGSWAMYGGTASGEGSWAMLNSIASGVGAWAMYGSLASGDGSWAMHGSTASGGGSWAMDGSAASGNGSWAMRNGTASGGGSWAMDGSTASGEGSWAMNGANASNNYAFSWRANSHGDGTFNIGPDGGVNGVYVGNTNLSWFLTHATDPNAVTNGGAMVNGFAVTNGAAILVATVAQGALADTALQPDGSAAAMSFVGMGASFTTAVQSAGIPGIVTNGQVALSVSNLTVAGTTTASRVKVPADTTTGYTIQDASGLTNTFVFDTLNRRFGIGTTPTYQIDVSSPQGTKVRIGRSGSTVYPILRVDDGGSGLYIGNDQNLAQQGALALYSRGQVATPCLWIGPAGNTFIGISDMMKGSQQLEVGGSASIWTNLSVGGSATVSNNLTVAGSVFLGPAINGNRARLFSDGTNLFFVTASLATTNALTSNP
jgi:hypothetical protein